MRFRLFGSQNSEIWAILQSQRVYLGYSAVSEGVFGLFDSGNSDIGLFDSGNSDIGLI